MSIVLVGSTSGSVTLQEPAVSGSTVLTLPAVTGTVLTTTSPKAGNVIQVVQATYATQVTSTSSTYADTNLTASITPSSTSSKILVMVNQNGLEKNTNDTSINIKLFRGATDLGQLSIASGFTSSSVNNNFGSFSFNYLDTPSTTSATTYKTQFASNGNNANVYVQRFGSTSTITLMEIAG